jgi:hypothetical protein
MVSTLEAQEAVTPAGSPVGVPIPVAPVVVRVMLVSGVLIHNVGLEDAVPAVLGVGQAGRSATITEAITRPPLFAGQFTLPLPVEPVVGRIAHAKPTAVPLLATLAPTSTISLSVVGLLAVAQVLKLAVVDGEPNREPAPSMTMAQLAVTVVTPEIPVMDVVDEVVMPVGTDTSNGLAELTPEKAAIIPEAFSEFVVMLNVKFVALTSEAVATLDKTVANPRELPMD